MHSSNDLTARIRQIAERARQRQREPTPEPTPQPAQVVRLPIWPAELRACPSCVLRSALFGVVRRGRRQYLQNQIVAAWADTTIRYTGIRLDQADLDVWLTALHLSRKQGLGARVVYSERPFPQALGRATKNVGQTTTGEKLWARLARSEPVGEVEFTLPAAPDRPARLVRQTLYRTVVTLPAHHGQPAVTVTTILAREEQPPAGEKAIEWRLLANRTADTLEDVVQLVDWYRKRWLIEQLHRELKQLTGIERCQCRKERAQRNHFACCYHAWYSLKVVARKLGKTLYQVKHNLWSDYLRAELRNPRIRAYQPA